MTNVPLLVMDRLKEATTSLHTRAENSNFQTALANGTLPLTIYVAYLGQLLLVHQLLERHLRNCMNSIPAFALVIKDYQFQEQYLRADLAYFEVNTAKLERLPATRQLIERIETTARTNPTALLGYHYVLEGSNNGAKFLAKSLRKAYGLPSNGGTNYLDPYGDQQRAHWLQFKQDMNSIGFSEEEVANLIEAAQTMFEGFVDIGDELYSLSEH